MMAAAISMTKKVHSMAHPHTKLWMRTSVAAGLSSPMMNQMPTPVSAPKTTLDQHEELAERLQVVEPARVVVAAGGDFYEDKIEAAADGEVRNEHVDDGDHGHQHAVPDADIPERIIHVTCSRCAAEPTILRPCNHTRPAPGNRENARRCERFTDRVSAPTGRLAPRHSVSLASPISL